MRGEGSVYLRGKTCWIRYCWHAKEYRESGETDNEGKAGRLLLARLRAVGTPKFVEPKEARYTLDDMLEKIRLRYQKKGYANSSMSSTVGRTSRRASPSIE